MALCLPFGWRREAIGRELGWGCWAGPTIFNGLFLGLDHPTLVVVEIGVHEHFGQEDFELGVLGTGILIKRVAAEIKAAGRSGRRRARVVEMSVTVDTSS